MDKRKIITLSEWAKNSGTPFSTAQYWASRSYLPVYRSLGQNRERPVILLWSDTPKPVQGGSGYAVVDELKTVPFITRDEWEANTGENANTLYARIKRGSIKDEDYYLSGGVLLVRSDLTLSILIDRSEVVTDKQAPDPATKRAPGRPRIRDKASASA